MPATSNLRTYGQPPYRVAVLHGGPGAPGGMAPVARQLSSRWGVLEPLQATTSVEGQIRELRALLEERGDPPVTLIGHSWGAWLGVLLAARCPALVRRLILVGSGPFEPHYAPRLQETRFGRLSEEEQQDARTLMAALEDPSADRDTALAQLGGMFSKTDGYDILDTGPQRDSLAVRSHVYRSVWREASAMRASGELLRIAGRIRCPVLAIHGEYDPHPAAGVQQPLSRTLGDFRLILLDKCGHQPWMERQARDRFYALLRQELTETGGADLCAGGSCREVSRMHKGIQGARVEGAG